MDYHKKIRGHKNMPKNNLALTSQHPKSRTECNAVNRNKYIGLDDLPNWIFQSQRPWRDTAEYLITSNNPVLADNYCVCS